MANAYIHFSPAHSLLLALCRVLDIRKFLDGIYVSEKGLATSD